MVGKYFAEFETDRVIREAYFPDFAVQGVMVEVGGATPDYISMSKHFRLNGWRTIVVEPNPHFVGLHRAQGNEVYECACSDIDAEDMDFQVVNWTNNVNYGGSCVTEHSFSAIAVKPEYLRKHNYKSIDSLPHTTIKVRVRRLDSLLGEIKVDRVDLLSVDTEGWEMEVMSGFDAAGHGTRVVVLENYLHDAGYTSYMSGAGYRLDRKIGHNYVYVR